MYPVIGRSFPLWRTLAVVVLLIGIVGLGLAACSRDGGETALSVGDEAPAFTLPSATGQDVSMDEFVGRQPVLLYFHMAAG